MNLTLPNGLAFTVDPVRKLVMPADEATAAALTWPVGDEEARGDAVDVVRELEAEMREAGLAWWQYGLVEMGR